MVKVLVDSFIPIQLRPKKKKKKPLGRGVKKEGTKERNETKNVMMIKFQVYYDVLIIVKQQTTIYQGG